MVIGFASGQVGTLSAGVALGKNIDLIGCYWGAYRDADADRIRRAYDELGRWVESGKLAPHVAALVPLAEAPRALALTPRSCTLAGKITVLGAVSDRIHGECAPAANGLQGGFLEGCLVIQGFLGRQCCQRWSR